MGTMPPAEKMSKEAKKLPREAIGNWQLYNSMSSVMELQTSWPLRTKIFLLLPFVQFSRHLLASDTCSTRESWAMFPVSRVELQSESMKGLGSHTVAIYSTRKGAALKVRTLLRNLGQTYQAVSCQEAILSFSLGPRVLLGTSKAARLLPRQVRVEQQCYPSSCCSDEGCFLR